MIDAKYNTIRTRDARAVLGASLGGVTSFWIGLKYPEHFPDRRTVEFVLGRRRTSCHGLGETGPVGEQIHVLSRRRHPRGLRRLAAGECLASRQGL
ncbi:MAG: hypothetical protein IPK58_17765 [Acidobacteria bacterium]|nr:hypothetical protein [Acidobacteriota bacterium]